MRVLLSNPPWFEDGGERWGIRAGSRWPFTVKCGQDSYKPFPFLMAYATSVLQQHGIEAYLVDSILSRESERSWEFRLQRIPFDYVVIETSSPSIENDLRLAEIAARYSKVVLAGPHVTVFADEVIKKPFVYAVLKGEYEKSLLKLVQTGEPGVYDYDITKDVDSLPFPFRDHSVYLYQDRFPVSPPGPQLQMWASRGCPYRCIFCLWPPVMYNSRLYRPRSPQNILDEIDNVLTRFPRFRSIYFDDDTFNIGDERIQELSRGLKEIGLPWQAMCRADTTSLETFRVMWESGCNAVKFGVESGSPRMIEVIQKNLDLDTVRKVVKELRSWGMFVHLTFTWGIPGETEEDRQMTWDLIRELNPDTFQQSRCIAFPGTPFWDMVHHDKDHAFSWRELDGQKALEEMVSAQDSVGAAVC